VQRRLVLLAIVAQEEVAAAGVLGDAEALVGVELGEP
jgi:hypothetical protein